jgi:hypothetical protein
VEAARVRVTNVRYKNAPNVMVIPEQNWSDHGDSRFIELLIDILAKARRGEVQFYAIACSIWDMKSRTTTISQFVDVDEEDYLQALGAVQMLVNNLTAKVAYVSNGI